MNKIKLLIMHSEESTTATGDLGFTLSVCVHMGSVNGDIDISLDINTCAFLRGRTQRCYHILSSKNDC